MELRMDGSAGQMSKLAAKLSRGTMTMQNAQCWALSLRVLVKFCVGYTGPVKVKTAPFAFTAMLDTVA